MKTRIFVASAILASVSTVALAQTGAAPATTAPPATAPAAPNTHGPSGTQIRSEIMSDLQKAGYSDVRVAPGSYIAEAKDKNGDATTLVVGPDAVTEIVMGPPVAGKAATAMPTGTAAFTSVPAGEELSSKVVGTDVYNKDNKDIGTIKDIAFTPHGAVKAYIVGVGGFLGMGDHYVAVRPSAMTISWKASDKKWHAMLDTNADTLKKAPEFKYPS